MYQRAIEDPTDIDAHQRHEMNKCLGPGGDEYFDRLLEVREMEIREAQTKCHEIAKSKGWWDKPRNDGELIALMHSELSEALEGLREGDMENVAEEMADVVIRVMDFCEAKQIDLSMEIVKKMQKNKLRSYRHGGKAF